MDSRYANIPTKINDSGKRVTGLTIYPPIPRDLSDIYVITTPGDRLDLLANTFYGSVGRWWIIAEANGIGKGSLSIPSGLQLRIPTNINKILQDFNNLNT